MRSRRARYDSLMGQLAVTLFCDFAEDRRISMEVYADNLRRALEAHCSVRQYHPSLLPLPVNGLARMRLSRFVGYPLQALRNQNHINHIVDHGYGHLLHVLDPKRTVVTVHDLIPLAKWHGRITGMKRGRKPWLNMIAFDALRRAAHLIAISENTRDDLIELCGCNPSQITVVHYGISPIFHPLTSSARDRVRRKWGFHGDNVFRVLISGSQFYKNQRGSLESFARLRARHNSPMEIIAVGMPALEWTNAVEELGLQRSARCIGTVLHDQMPEIYNCVDCLLFPSFYEGFGWPPLEAMACGIPAITSCAGSLPEIVGDGGLLVDPLDVEALTQALHKVFADAELRASMVVRGFEWVRKFRWEDTALKTMTVYEQVARQLS